MNHYWNRNDECEPWHTGKDEDVTDIIMSQKASEVTESDKQRLEREMPIGTMLTVTSSSAGVIGKWEVIRYIPGDKVGTWLCMVMEADCKWGQPLVFSLWLAITCDIEDNIERRQNVNKMHKTAGWNVRDLIIPRYSVSAARL